MQVRESRFDILSHDPTITVQETTTELERILSDPAFRATERNRNFLRYVTEKLLEGEEAAVKAYSIAVDVFGRPEDFDPTIDPIVRIEATRLRASLEHYYALHGQDGGLRIDLPKGGYVPAFSRLGRTCDRIPSSTSWLGRSDKVPLPNPKPASLSKWAGFSIGGIGGLLLGFVLFHVFDPQSVRISEKPTVTIDVISAGAGTNAEELRNPLMVALSQFRTLKLMRQPAGGDGPKPQGSSPAAWQDSSYRVELKFSQDELAQSVWWQIIDLHSGEVLISRSQTVQGSKSPSLIRILAGRLATQIAGFEGVINSTETRRDIANPTLGNGCVLRSRYSLRSADLAALEAARTCMERTVAHRPGDADAYAVLSIVLLAIDPPEAPTELAARALELANRSAQVAPFSALSALAQSEALFRSGRTEEAVLAGRRAALLNPNDSEALAKIGKMLCIVGRWGECISLVMKAGQTGHDAIQEADIALAMDAYRRGAFEETLVHLRQRSNALSCNVDILRTAALGQLGRKREAEAGARSLRESCSGIDVSFRSYMTARHFDGQFVSLLGNGLSKAGMRVQ